MASPLTQQTERVAERFRVAAPRWNRVDDGGLTPFPASALSRWLLRAAFAVPYLVIAILGISGRLAFRTNNQVILGDVAGIHWDQVGVKQLAELYPPIASILAELFRLALPDPTFVFAIVGALVAGVVLQKMLEIMVHRHMPVSTTAILLVALAANPLFAYMVVENTAEFLALAFFGLGLAEMARFVLWGNTQSGFRAGLAFLAASLSSPAAIVYVAACALAAPFLRWRRSSERGARSASIVILIFPTVSAFVALALLQLLFLGDPFRGLWHVMFAAVPARTALLVQVFESPRGLLVVLPVVASCVISALVGRPGAIVMSILTFVALLGGYAIGLVPFNAAGTVYIVMILLAIALIPPARALGSAAAVDIICVAQIVMAWLMAMTVPAIGQWLQIVAAGAQHLLR